MSAMGQIPSHVAQIARAIVRAGHPCYLVGGAVRGAVMGLPAADYDICGPATVEQVEEAVREDASIECSRRYGKMGTMRLTAPGGYVEYTTFRRERYEGGHTPVEVSFVGTAGEDALRRDFTCNALYLDIAGGEIVDPTGGLSDIAARTLRATTEDPAIIMRDDGLRVLRLVRFAAQLRFGVDPDTLACADASLLRDIAAERIAGELVLILLSDARYDLPGGRDALLSALKRMEALKIWDVIAPGCPLDFASCAQVPPKVELRLAALLRTCPEQRAQALLEGLRLPSALVRYVGNLIRDAGSGVGDRCFLLQKGYAYAEDIVALRPEWGEELRLLRGAGAPDSLEELAIGGEDVALALGGPSPRVGKALRALWRYAVLHPERNNRGDLTGYLERMIGRNEL